MAQYRVTHKKGDSTINLVRNSRIKDSIKITLQRETQYNKPG